MGASEATIMYKRMCLVFMFGLIISSYGKRVYGGGIGPMYFGEDAFDYDSSFGLLDAGDFGDDFGDNYGDDYAGAGGDIEYWDDNIFEDLKEGFADVVSDVADDVMDDIGLEVDDRGHRGDDGNDDDNKSNDDSESNNGDNDDKGGAGHGDKDQGDGRDDSSSSDSDSQSDETGNDNGDKHGGDNDDGDSSSDSDSNEDSDSSSDSDSSDSDDNGNNGDSDDGDSDSSQSSDSSNENGNGEKGKGSTGQVQIDISDIDFASINWEVDGITVIKKLVARFSKVQDGLTQLAIRLRAAGVSEYWINMITAIAGVSGGVSGVGKGSTSHIQVDISDIDIKNVNWEVDGLTVLQTLVARFANVKNGLDQLKNILRAAGVREYWINQIAIIRGMHGGISGLGKGSTGHIRVDISDIDLKNVNWEVDGLTVLHTLVARFANVKNGLDQLKKILRAAGVREYWINQIAIIRGMHGGISGLGKGSTGHIRVDISDIDLKNVNWEVDGLTVLHTLVARFANVKNGLDQLKRILRAAGVREYWINQIAIIRGMHGGISGLGKGSTGHVRVDISDIDLKNVNWEVDGLTVLHTLVARFANVKNGLDQLKRILRAAGVSDYWINQIATIRRKYGGILGLGKGSTGNVQVDISDIDLKNINWEVDGLTVIQMLVARFANVKNGLSQLEKLLRAAGVSEYWIQMIYLVKGVRGRGLGQVGIGGESGIYGSGIINRLGGPFTGKSVGTIKGGVSGKNSLEVNVVNVKGRSFSPAGDSTNSLVKQQKHGSTTGIGGVSGILHGGKVTGSSGSVDLGIKGQSHGKGTVGGHGSLGGGTGIGFNGNTLVSVLKSVGDRWGSGLIGKGGISGTGTGGLGTIGTGHGHLTGTTTGTGTGTRGLTRTSHITIGGTGHRGLTGTGTGTRGLTGTGTITHVGHTGVSGTGRGDVTPIGHVGTGHGTATGHGTVTGHTRVTGTGKIGGTGIIGGTSSGGLRGLIGSMVGSGSGTKVLNDLKAGLGVGNMHGSGVVLRQGFNSGKSGY